MPNAKDNAKLTGDLHPPEVGDDDGGAGAGAEEAPVAQGSRDAPADESLRRDLQDEGRPGKGINQAGYLKDKDSPDAGGSGKP
jgi:hypothetical protein